MREGESGIGCWTADSATVACVGVDAAVASAVAVAEAEVVVVGEGIAVVEAVDDAVARAGEGDVLATGGWMAGSPCPVEVVVGLYSR